MMSTDQYTLRWRRHAFDCMVPFDGTEDMLLVNQYYIVWHSQETGHAQTSTSSSICILMAERAYSSFRPFWLLLGAVR